MIFLTLIQNVALLVALASTYQVIASRFRKTSVGYQILSGLLFGGVGLVGMMTPLSFAPGIIFDGRSIILAVSGLLGGPLVGAVAATICGVYRLWLGGAGAWVGLGVILESTALGVLFYYRWRVAGREIGWLSLWIFGLLVHVIMLVLFLAFPGGAGPEVLRRIGLPILLLYPLATMLVCRLFIDYEAQRQDKEALQESEERHRTLIEHLPQRIFVKDRNSIYLSCNANYAKDLGTTPEQIVGKDDFAFHSPELAQLYRADDQECLLTGVVKDLEEPYHMAGQTRWAHTVKVPFRDGYGRTIGVLGIYEDITDRRRAEEAVRIERDRAQRYLDIAGVMIVAIDRNQKVVLANKKACEVLGWDEPDVIGKNWFDNFLPEEGREALKRAFSELIGGNIQSWEYHENTVMTKQGTKRLIAWHNTILRDPQGGVEATLSSGEDITDRKRAEAALAESEERYRTLFDRAGDGIIVVDIEGDSAGAIVSANRMAAEMHGYEMDEFLRLRMSDLDTPEETARTAAYIANVQEGRILKIEHCHRKKDGTVVPIELSAGPIEIKGHKYSLSINRDITERKKSEQALVESERRHRHLFEYSPVSLWEEDFSHVKEYIDRLRDAGVNDFRRHFTENPAAVRECAAMVKILDVNLITCEMYGAADKNELLRELEAVLCEESYTTIREEFIAVAEGIQEFQIESTNRNLRGEKIDILLKWSTMPGSEETYSNVLVSVVDITERKRSEAERVLLATAIEQAAESVEITNSDGIIVYVNPAFERTTGYSLGEVVGRKPTLLASGEHDSGFYREMWETICSGRPWTGNLVNKRKNGKIFEEEVTISPVKDLSGGIVNYVAVKRDVTNEVLLRNQLLEAQKMEAVGTLAGGIAHDFNNLLQVIGGFAEMAQFEIKEGHPGHSELSEIRTAARTAAELTQGLLTFSRRVESKLRPVDLNQEIDRLTKMLRRTLPRLIKIELDLSDPLHTVRADPSQLQQVIMNLAVNARDAMPEGGTLTIETSNVYLDQEYCDAHLDSAPGHYVLLSVSDSGTGMDEKTRRHIFDPFFTTKETGEGTGLGLSIAFGIVKSHGGNLLCYSEPGHGTTFKIYLPAKETIEDGEEKPESAAVAGGSETVLVVDDEDMVRKLVSQVLQKFRYTVLTASNGSEGVKVFSREKNRIDLVILDLIMPEMGGRDCLKEILKLAPKTRVIIASGYAANGQIDKALGEGAKASVLKPYEARQLLELVRQVLDQE